MRRRVQRPYSALVVLDAARRPVSPCFYPVPPACVVAVAFVGVACSLALPRPAYPALMSR
eukprot:3086067-Pleurochrysis_carterae.AAC.4